MTYTIGSLFHQLPAEQSHPLSGIPAWRWALEAPEIPRRQASLMPLAQVSPGGRGASGPVVQPGQGGQRPGPGQGS